MSGRGTVARIVTLASRTGKYGGPTDTAVRQAELLCGSGWKAVVIAGAMQGDEPDDPYVTTAPVRRWVPRAGYTGLFSFGVARLVHRAVTRADIAHISMAREAVPIWALLCSIATRTPAVVQPHGMLTSRSSAVHRAIDVILRPLVRRADAIVALTDTEREALGVWLGRRPPRMYVLGNPSPQIEARPESPQIVLFAARLHPRKRVRDFIEAARIFDAGGTDVRFVIVGPDQGDLQMVERAVHELACLEYLGAVSKEEVSSLLARSSAFVLPSENEPWGNVLATAVKAAIPVILAHSAALGEELSDYGAAIIVPDRSPEAIATALSAVLQSREEYDRGFNKAAVTARLSNGALNAGLARVYEDAGVKLSRE